MRYINYRMYDRIRNFGDSINPTIIGYAADAMPIHCYRKREHLLAIGSISFYNNIDSIIWGSGVINPSIGYKPTLPSQIRALRGKKSLEYYRNNGCEVGDVPLGDPGYLMSEAVPINTSNKKYKACFIPHHKSIDNDLFVNISESDEYCVFNILSDDIRELNKIANSECVISQSLHGLIFAESYKIPSCWISDKFDDKWKFKFQDWFSTAEEPWVEPLSLAQDPRELIKSSRRCFSSVDKAMLTNAFPRELVYSDDSKFYLSPEDCKKQEISILNYSKLSRLSNSGEPQNLFNAMSKQIKNIAMGAQNVYSYPVYTAIGSSLEQFSKDLLVKASRLMDMKIQFPLAFLATKNELKRKAIKVYEVDGLCFSKDAHVTSNLLLRPNCDLSISKGFLTIYI